MAEDEVAKDRNVNDPSPDREIQARSDATNVISWGIELKIIRSSEIR